MKHSASFKKGVSSWNKGLKLSEEHKQKLREAKLGKVGYWLGKNRGKIPWLPKFPKGHEPWNKGKLFLAITGEKHPAWKGDKVGYYALHDWVQSRKGKAKYCLYAKTLYSDCRGQYEWANISQEYERDINDYMSLCNKHHNQYDSKFKVKAVARFKELERRRVQF